MEITTMNEHFFERIRVLERSVRRWRLATFALVLLLISFLAIGATVGLVMLGLQLPDRRGMMERERAEMERARAEEAFQRAEQARREADAARAREKRDADA